MPDWDKLYDEKQVLQAHPASVLREHKQLLPDHGTAMDYACGLGGNAVMLAEAGMETLALDNSAVAVDKINQFASDKKISLKAECRDLESNPPSFRDAFDVIVVSYFLHRQTLPLLPEYLKPGGLLFYQTFSGIQQEGRGPSNPDFRLQRGELLDVFGQMELVAYREYPCLEKNIDLACDQVQFVARKI